MKSHVVLIPSGIFENPREMVLLARTPIQQVADDFFRKSLYNCLKTTQLPRPKTYRSKIHLGMMYAFYPDVFKWFLLLGSLHFVGTSYADTILVLTDPASPETASNRQSYYQNGEELIYRITDAQNSRVVFINDVDLEAPRDLSKEARGDRISGVILTAHGNPQVMNWNGKHYTGPELALKLKSILKSLRLEGSLTVYLSSCMVAFDQLEPHRNSSFLDAFSQTLSLELLARSELSRLDVLGHLTLSYSEVSLKPFNWFRWATFKLGILRGMANLITKGALSPSVRAKASKFGWLIGDNFSSPGAKVAVLSGIILIGSGFLEIAFDHKVSGVLLLTTGFFGMATVPQTIKSIVDGASALVRRITRFRNGQEIQSLGSAAYEFEEALKHGASCQVLFSQ